MTGGGFGGCTVTLAHASCQDELYAHIMKVCITYFYLYIFLFIIDSTFMDVFFFICYNFVGLSSSFLFCDPAGWRRACVGCAAFFITTPFQCMERVRAPLNFYHTFTSFWGSAHKKIYIYISDQKSTSTFPTKNLHAQSNLIPSAIKYLRFSYIYIYTNKNLQSTKIYWASTIKSTWASIIKSTHQK